MTSITKTSILAAFLASGGLVGMAVAQTTPGTTGTTSGTMTSPSTMGATTSRPASTATGTTMPSTSAAPAAVTTTTGPSRTTAAPVAGANSFTEGEARSRIQDKGFGQVTDLKKDDKGVWRGTATKDGKSMSVALDYQGNVVSQ